MRSSVMANTSDNGKAIKEAIDFFKASKKNFSSEKKLIVYCPEKYHLNNEEKECKELVTEFFRNYMGNDNEISQNNIEFIHDYDKDQRYDLVFWEIESNTDKCQMSDVYLFLVQECALKSSIVVWWRANNKCGGDNQIPKKYNSLFETIQGADKESYEV
ncbi:MAG: hypothetical protein IKO40_10555, partial [Kiritimatiellae bacterium]|nr:hypothetical protein [Kiritimatiellia bacterium]